MTIFSWLLKENVFNFKKKFYEMFFLAKFVLLVEGFGGIISGYVRILSCLFFKDFVLNTQNSPFLIIIGYKRIFKSTSPKHSIQNPKKVSKAKFN